MNQQTVTRKVYYANRCNSGKHYKRHPVIRLGGNYLSALDFKIGDTIAVSLSPGKIVITKVL